MVSAASFDPDQIRARARQPDSQRDPGGTSRGRSVLVAARRDAKTWSFRFTTRPGPPPDIRDHLFEPFVTGRADGTGLGLSIVREVAEAHGGIARLGNSQTGNTLRDRHAMAVILIVDDDAAMCDALSETVRGLGYRARVASSGGRRSRRLATPQSPPCCSICACPAWTGSRCCAVSANSLARRRSRC